jgi:methionyl-tRNA synthetase
MTTPKKILVAVAWPYASGSRHLGHLAGAYLPADVFARYQRAIGNDVLMVSGSDVHGRRSRCERTKKG